MELNFLVFFAARRTCGGTNEDAAAGDCHAEELRKHLESLSEMWVIKQCQKGHNILPIVVCRLLAILDFRLGLCSSISVCKPTEAQANTVRGPPAQL